MGKPLPIRPQVPITPGISGRPVALSGEFVTCHPQRAERIERPVIDLRKEDRTLAPASLWPLLLCLALALPVEARSQSAAPVVLDRVVAVVNNQAILASDIDNEIRLSVLDPGRGGLGVLTRARALDQLIGRDLIQQQIRQQDLQSTDPTPAEITGRLTEIRNEIPACVRQNCASDAGWKTFLTTHGLTQERVEAYLRFRVQILRFIEQRFRQGISIEPKDIETYYHDVLVPQYAKGEAVPSLDQVSTRIEEILLQQRVNALFDDWLGNLRKEGEIEVLDPTLEAPTPEAPVPQTGPAATSPSGSNKGSQ